MRNLVFVSAFCFVAVFQVHAQNELHLPASFSPNTNDLNRLSSTPFMRAESVSQCFYSATEAGRSAFAARSFSLRYDGPIPPAGGPGPYRVQRFRVLAGVTAVVSPGTDLRANVTAPLATVFDASLTYLPDTTTASGPEPWGGPGNQFVFPLATPIVISIPANGWFVVQIVAEGNDNVNAAHAMLDAAQGPGGPSGGSAASSGTGCPAGPSLPPAAILTAGQYAPGAAHTISGRDLGANAPVITAVGASDWLAFGSVPLPYALPGTSCSLQTSWDLLLVRLADASGALQPNAPGSFVQIPPDPALDNALLFEQHVSLVPGANPFGVVLSDKRTVTLGRWVAPIHGIWFASNGDSAAAMVATSVAPLGLALRIETL